MPCKKHLHRSLRALALIGGLHCGASVHAQDSLPVDTAEAAPAFHYALGVLATSSPPYAGGGGRSNHLSPAWAVEYGRFRLSTSRGSMLMGHGLRAQDSGASATLAQGDRFNLSALLRIDNGRDGADAPLLADLPPVRTTLRARVAAGYALTPRWSLGAGVSQDLLNRGGGAQLSTSLGYTWPVSQDTKVVWGMGMSFADRTYMRSHFGVPASTASAGHLPKFDPSSGIYSVDAGVEVITAITPHWVALAAARVSQVQGDARRSPLTVRPTGYSISMGLAYRCCR